MPIMTMDAGIKCKKDLRLRSMIRGKNTCGINGICHSVCTQKKRTKRCTKNATSYERMKMKLIQTIQFNWTKRWQRFESDFNLTCHPIWCATLNRNSWNRWRDSINNCKTIQTYTENQKIKQMVWLHMIVGNVLYAHNWNKSKYSQSDGMQMKRRAPPILQMTIDTSLLEQQYILIL